MTARVAAATSRDAKLVDALCGALTRSALPGETAGFDAEACAEASAFVAETAGTRMPGEAVVRMKSLGGAAGRRRMRIAIVNDDMPFLVDSLAGALAARNITIHRLLHPVVPVKRDKAGAFRSLGDGGLRESIIYLETDRADAKDRREIGRELEHVLADVRAGVTDWKAMEARLAAEASGATGSENRAFLEWIADHNFTLLGHRVMTVEGKALSALGVLRSSPQHLFNDATRAAAFAYFAGGGEAPLLQKADRISTVHRRVPLDLVILPAGEGALSVHAGLWTSAALKAPPEEVPILRTRLAAMDQKLGFHPQGHAAKALRHAVASLPHDLLVAIPAEAVETISLTAMSLADRPRPALLLLTDALGLHIFAFVWLPRDELNTSRRLAIAELLEAAATAEILNWSVELGDGELALIRFTLGIAPGTKLPDQAMLDRRIVEMVKGWEPGVEAELVEAVGPTRATRLSLTYLDAFPESYRERSDASSGAQDILRLCALDDAQDRDARLYRKEGDSPCQLRLKTYRKEGLIPLSDAVPVLENFGFRVLEEIPTELGGGKLGNIHEFLLEVPVATKIDDLLGRGEVVETAIAAVLQGKAENDEFNQLIMLAGLEPGSAVLFRAWFRYLRQTGVSYGLLTIVEALRRALPVTQGLVAFFEARHSGKGGDADAAARAVDEGLAKVAAIDDDRILRLFRAVIDATLRTNAYVASGREALAFKFDSKLVPNLPAPVPWREIWVYSPRVEGIHLRSGPVARGGLRWSDRRDDFRTEILGLMKAQVVKNAVIVPTGAKGGFYPKQLPPPGERDAWLAVGTEAYRIFIRALLAITDNIVADKIVHPEGIAIHDGDDPYFVVAADKGTAKFSDVANALAIERGFWLGDAFASGGSQGYDHKAMGITAKGAWISVRRHFGELGIDIQTQPVRVVGCGDMSGDVFGNGMLLSQSIKLVAAFDHRHIFLDPDPDPAKSFAERKRMFELPRSSWDEYDRKILSAGGGVFPRTQKQIPVSPEARAVLGVDDEVIDPAALIAAILKSPADLLWFGGIGTYVKGSDQNHVEVGDPANDALRADASEIRARVIGEGANLAITQLARIEFAARGGRINTDFIDNSAGVDCSDNEVNIKIALNREMAEGRLSEPDRNALLAQMTDEVAELVLDDNRLQSLALSIAEAEGTRGLPAFVRTIELLEGIGTLDREVEGLQNNDELLRRGGEDRGLTRPELAVLLSTSKIALQQAIEAGDLPDDPLLESDLMAAFPPQMQAREADAIQRHRLRREIISTKIANRFVNRLGITAPLDLTEEEGATLEAGATAFVAAERLLDMQALWEEIDGLAIAESARLDLYAHAAKAARLHVSDLVRAAPADATLGHIVATLKPGYELVYAATSNLLRAEARGQAAAYRARLSGLGAPEPIVERIVRLFELDGVFGIVALSERTGVDVIKLAEAYTRLGETLGLDWAQSAAGRYTPGDGWERLLTAGLARDFEQLRIDFLGRCGGGDPGEALDRWGRSTAPRIEQFRRIVDRARTASVTTAPMLAQIASQARLLLSR